MVASLLTLLGVIFTGSVTFVGLLFRNAVDRRTTALAERADTAREADQRRLQMDSALRTVQLLTLPDGTPAPLVQASSAVLALAGLGETGLALSLVRELWPTGSITSSSAVRVIHDALLDADVHAQRAAANVLLSNVDRLDVGGHQQEWPPALEHWSASRDLEVRQAAALALIRWLALRPPSGAGDFRLRLLEEVRLAETDPRVRAIPGVT